MLKFQISICNGKIRIDPSFWKYKAVEGNLLFGGIVFAEFQHKTLTYTFIKVGKKKILVLHHIIIPYGMIDVIFQVD